MNRETLFLFTNEYPYGKGESFITNELKFLSGKFKQIYLFPLKNVGKGRPLPAANIEVVFLFELPIKHKFQHVFGNMFFFLKIIILEFLNSPQKYKWLICFPQLKSSLYQNFYRAEISEKYLKNINYSSVFYYSFWTDDWVTVLSILKQRKIINRFISRVHGYDLYKERWPNEIIPFRYFQLKNVSKIFAVSKAGLKYLISNYPSFKSKFFLSHLNSFDSGIGPFDPEKKFTIVSCSAIIPLKRVHLVVEILMHIKFDVKWIHFGEGEQFDMIKLKCRKLPDNVMVDLKGFASNDSIINFYKNNSINLFIHLSETEGGVPLALQEACSFGIPLLGTNVGGIPEIVTEETGILIPVDFDIDKVAGIINNFKDNYLNTIAFRNKSRAFWLKNFNDEANYNKLFNEI